MNDIIPTNWPLAHSKEALIRKLADSFLEGKNERTQRAYQQDLRDFAAFLGINHVNDACLYLVQQEHGTANSIALSYKAHLVDRVLSPATINRRLSSLRSIVLFANTCGLVDWKLNIKNERAEKYKDTTGVSVAMFRKLLSTAANQKHNAKNKRDVAILRLCFDLALRRNEIRLLDYPNDLNLELGHIWILGKGKREKQKLSLASQTITALKEWVAIRGDFDGPLFIQFSRAIKETSRISNRGLTDLVSSLGRKIGLSLSIHSLRHTSLTQAVKSAAAAGIDLTEVLQFSRHSKSSGLSTLMIYRDNDRDCQGKISELVASEV